MASKAVSVLINKQYVHSLCQVRPIVGTWLSVGMFTSPAMVDTLMRADIIMVRKTVFLRKIRGILKIEMTRWYVLIL